MLALDLKAPADAGKLRQARANQILGNIEREPHGRRGGGIAHVVNSRRRRQAEHAQRLAVILQAKLAHQALQPHVADHQVRLARRAVGDHRALHARDDRLHVGLIQAQNHRTVERHAVHKLHERVLNFFERSVLIEMLAVDRGDHRDHRREQQKRAVAFVRFHHHVFALPHDRARARMVHAPAHHERGIELGGGQNGSDQRSRGGFAVRAGDGDAEFQPHQLRQHFRARNHGNLQPVRFDHLDIVLRHGGGNHHHVRALDVRGAMPFVNRRAQVVAAAR